MWQVVVKWEYTISADGYTNAFFIAIRLIRRLTAAGELKKDWRIFRNTPQFSLSLSLLFSFQVWIVVLCLASRLGIESTRGDNWPARLFQVFDLILSLLLFLSTFSVSLIKVQFTAVRVASHVLIDVSTFLVRVGWMPSEFSLKLKILFAF